MSEEYISLDKFIMNVSRASAARQIRLITSRPQDMYYDYQSPPRTSQSLTLPAFALPSASTRTLWTPNVSPAWTIMASTCLFNAPEASHLHSNRG